VIGAGALRRACGGFRLLALGRKYRTQWTQAIKKNKGGAADPARFWPGPAGGARAPDPRPPTGGTRGDAPVPLPTSGAAFSPLRSSTCMPLAKNGFEG
jgi:hypothetical protein